MAKVTQAEYQKVQDSLNNQYTSDSLSQYKTAYNDYKAQGMSTADAVQKAQSLLVAKGAGTSNTNKADTTINNNVPSGSTGSQQSSYSNYNKPNVDVSREAPVPKQYQVESKAAEDAASKIGAKWNEKSFEEQQYYLNNIPGLKEALAKRGITAKTGKEFATPTTPTTPTTSDRNTPKGEWDYQDDSPERMSQIIDNLNRLRQSDPYLFSDYNAFYKAFIDGKGRTQGQIDTLNSYFNSMKKYGQYDSMSPEDIGVGLVNGTIPDDYLTYVKNADPQRYAEIQDARKKGEDKIKDEAALDTINVMTGEGSTSTSNVIEWLKKQGLFVDEDGNLIDDRTENYASEEELGYQKQIADLNATNLDIDNTVKHTYDDLVKKYPGATKATLMAMAQDMNADLLREKENNLVELTRLQGYVGYMQQEREDRTNIGKDSIAQLQKEYGMYYTYSPEGMSELAQAQYAATNVTLDQADNGTDTQKQMALDSVLTDYFDKYGSIIQRSKSQVINDVMALAKNKGISLSQALEENFLKPLRAKPGFAALNTVESKDPYVVKVGDVAYRYNPETDEFELIGGGTIGGALGGGTTNGQLYGFTNYTSITESQKTSGLDSFMSKHPLNSTGGECGSFVNDYLQSLGYDRLYTDPIDKKKAVTNSDTATVGSVAVMDSKKYPQYGHTAIVTDVQGDKVKLLESNWNDDHKVHERRVNKSDILGYFDPSKNPTPATTTNQNGKYGAKSNWNPDGYSNNLVKEYEAYLADPTYENNTDLKYKLGEFGMSFEDFTEQAANYARTGMKADQISNTADSLEAAINLYEYINGNKSTLLGFKDPKQGGLFDWLGGYIPGLGGDAYDAKGYYDTLTNRLTLDKLIETKKQGATYGAMSEGEWKLLKNSATSLNWDGSSEKFQKNLEDMIWTMTRAIIEGGGKLPSNFSGSAASKYYLESKKSGKYDPYIKDNTPMNYSNNSSGTPSRLS